CSTAVLHLLSVDPAYAAESNRNYWACAQWGSPCSTIFSEFCGLPYPTNDVRLMTQYATEAVSRIFRPGFRYSKAEVLLMDICQPGEFTDDLFAASQPMSSDRLMAALDMINGKWGRGTLRTGSVPVVPDWGMRREQMSQSYTTRLDQLWVVKAK
ncbi:DUF4113 domain-containing protein, partial [Pseudomonas savastanoi]|uniref:DUF4113 domain-containing protein n=1 Tax=Pseudomonas savastanoi TaxID=29438 RepID=UPI001EE77D95